MTDNVEIKCDDLSWVDKLLKELEVLYPDLPALEDPNLKELLQLDFCNVISNDPTKLGTAGQIFGFYKQEIDNVSRANNTMSKTDSNALLLDGISRSIESALNFEIERVKTHNSSIEQELNNNLIKAKIYEVTTNSKLAIATLRFTIYEACTRFTMELDKLAFDKTLAMKKFCLEEMIAHANAESLHADYTLKKTQAISFVFNQRAKLVDTLFNTLIVGVTQELMHILAEENEMLGGISPREKFEEAWIKDDPFLNEIDSITWEGLCKPKKCLCEICEE